MGNTALRSAKRAKNDEFYPQSSDIEEKCARYKEHFRGKTVFCNCDAPESSRFWRYFPLNFSLLGLKKLVSTHFAAQDLFMRGDAYKMKYAVGQDGGYHAETKTALEENGDFRSAECIKILKDADMIVTDPPFSLFREYVTLLVEHKKNFLITGNMNALTYKEIFPRIRENKMRLGNDNGGEKWYDMKTETRIKIENGVKYFSTGSILWLTNSDRTKRHENLILYKRYNPGEYPKYDNYDAIEVSKVAEIPADYEDVIGVPVTFLDKYNPEQFKITGNLGRYAPEGHSSVNAICVNGKKNIQADCHKKKGIKMKIELQRAMKGVGWGELYNRFKDTPLDPEKLARVDEREMEGDHIDPWYSGGKTTNAANCQILCRPCNRRKSGK
ncbi:MAG: HNH endonuclease [Zoogloeaceae bacterium]|jgi:hypothetical protein|nr:HNH endonuclease [Zoogloeaceae bacterium]